jgi:signal peptidase I
VASLALLLMWALRPRQRPAVPYRRISAEAIEPLPGLAPVHPVHPAQPEAAFPDESVAVISAEPKNRPSRRSRLVTASLLMAGVVVLGLGIWARVVDLRFNTVVSNSMRPTFSAGDVVITEPVAVDSLQVGDVIAFIPPKGAEPEIHRIVSIEDGVISTRGDANSADDPWQLVPTSANAYRLFAVIPLLGWVTRLELPLLLLAALFACLALLQIAWKGVVGRRKRLQPQPQS